MIETFDGEYSFLSNFFFSPIFINSNIYSTVEHYYQAMKTNNTDAHEFIRKTSTAKEAKRLGKSVRLRSDWESAKNEIMLAGLTAKFRQNKELAQKLLDTGDEELQEGNYWGDSYWGVDLKRGEGENKLGHLLMQVREELKNE